MQEVMKMSENKTIENLMKAFAGESQANRMLKLPHGVQQ